MTTPQVEAAHTFDVIGVGLGPFNLGLAALLEPVAEIDAAFFDARTSFAWHPGLMLTGTTLQVPFLADLVTLTDPTSRYSFLNYLHERNRLYRFYFYERFHIPRAEFDAYARWVAGSLASCRFGHTVESVQPNSDATWTVQVRTAGGHQSTDRPEHPERPEGPDGAAAGELIRYRARSVVFGVGSRPRVPAVARDVLGEDIFHAADYLNLREKVAGATSATVVGSGQSAGEVVADLLENSPDTGQCVDWFTRSAGFLPMEYSKLGLEHFSPEYTAYFHGLPQQTRDRIRSGQDLLYKGLSEETSGRIYDLLYQATIDAEEPPLRYLAGCELHGIHGSPVPGRRWLLTWRHRDEDRTFTTDTDVLILATGYDPAPLPISSDLIDHDDAGRPVVEADYRLRLAGERSGAPSSLFVQNGELHTHGVGAPDLGLGAYRNAVIVNALAGRQVYPVPDRTVFQRFGTAALRPAPDRAGRPGGTAPAA